MTFFLQMGQDQPLPVPIQHIFTAVSLKLQTTAPFSRLHPQMDLRIVAQRLKMAYPFYRLRKGLLVYNTSRAEFHFHTKTVRDQLL